MRRRRPLLTMLLLVLGGCVHAPSPADVYLSGQRESALEEQRLAAAEPDRDQALDQVELASMALALGQPDLAEAALRSAVGRMQTFTADGEFAAVLGAEARKEWKGEPYEKLAACLTLGVLLHSKGDRGNALAMYKSAILADTGTAEERYRSDFVPAWVMQALAYQAEGEADNAQEAARRAVDARYSRALLDLLGEALLDTRPPDLSTGDLQLAQAALLAAMSAGVTAAARDPQEAARATVSYAGDLLRQQRDRAARDRLDALQGFSAGDFSRAQTALARVAPLWQAQVAALPTSALDEAARFAARLDALLAQAPNIVLLVEDGAGPRKMQAGRYGQILQIVPGREGGGLEPVSLDGRPLEPLWLDSLTWQATTRGGRRVDGFLQGKAIFKDVSLITGDVLLELADYASYRGNDEMAGALAIVGGALYVAGLFTNPAADVRDWELLPESYSLITAHAAPGLHTVEIRGRSYTVKVSERGQTVALIPRLAPGGASEIGGD